MPLLLLKNDNEVIDFNHELAQINWNVNNRDMGQNHGKEKRSRALL